MSRSSHDILKEYLVSIGFKIDESGHKKLQEKMGGLTKTMVRFRDSAILASIALSVTVKSMASDLEKLYFASQRTGSSASELNAWGLAAQNAGVSADTARAAAEGLAAAVRRNPGIGVLLRGLGVDTTKGSVAELNQLVDKLSSMGAPGTAGYAVATQYASMFGIDEQTLFMLEKNREEVKKTQAQYAAWLKQMGLNSDGIDKITAHSHDFMDNLRTLESHLDVLAILMVGHLLPAGDKVVGWLTNFVDWAIKADKATGGWTTTIGGLVASFGVLQAAKVALSTVGGALGVGGGSAAGGGALAAGAGAAVTTGLVGVAGGSLLLAANKKSADAYTQTVGDYGAALLGKMGLSKSAQDAIGNALIGANGNWLSGGSGVGNSLARLENFVGRKEGFRPHAYWDVDHYSIGFGTRANSANEVIDENEGARRRNAVLRKERAFVMSRVTGIPPGMIDALTSLVYNVGEGALKENRKYGNKLLADLRGGNTQAAADDFLNFDKVRRNGVLVRDAGLHSRREQERTMALQGGSTITQTANITVTGVSDPHAAGKAAHDGTMNAFMDLLRNNNNLGATPR